MTNIFNVEEQKKILEVKEKIKTKHFTSKVPFMELSDPVFLTGGVFYSLFHNEEPNDWDMYFLDVDVQQKFVQELLKSHQDSIKDVDERYKDAVGENGKMITANAITLKDGRSFITKWCGTPHFVRSQFDYVHCTPYFYCDKLYISRIQYDAIMKKKLIVNNPQFVKEYRKQKFLMRGFTE